MSIIHGRTRIIHLCYGFLRLFDVFCGYVYAVWSSHTKKNKQESFKMGFQNKSLMTIPQGSRSDPLDFRIDICSVSRKKWLLQASETEWVTILATTKCNPTQTLFPLRRILRKDLAGATPIRGESYGGNQSGFASKALKNDGKSEEFELQNG